MSALSGMMAARAGLSHWVGLPEADLGLHERRPTETGIMRTPHTGKKANTEPGLQHHRNGKYSAQTPLLGLASYQQITFPNSKAYKNMISHIHSSHK